MLKDILDDFIMCTYGITVSQETYKKFYDTFVMIYDEISLEDKTYISDEANEKWYQMYPEIYRYQNGDIHIRRMDNDLLEYIDIMRNIKENNN